MIRDPNFGNEGAVSVGVKGFWEHPRQLEAGLYQHNGVVVFFKFHRRVQIGDGDVVAAGSHDRLRQAVFISCKGHEHGGLFVSKVATKSNLYRFNVLPTVLVNEFHLNGVGDTWVEWCVVIVADDGGIAEIDGGLKFLSNKIRHQVS